MDEDAIASSTLAGGLATPVARLASVFMLGSWACLILLVGPPQAGQVGVIVAAASCFISAMIVTIREPRRLTRQEAAWVVALGACAAYAALAAAPGVGDLLLFNTAAHVVVLLIPRGNPVAGVVGWVIAVGYGLLWALPRHPGPRAVAELVGIPVGALVGCLVWRYVVVAITRRRVAGRTSAAASQESSARALAEVQASRDQLRGFRDLARPVLLEVAAGAHIDDDMRRRLAQVEAEIRDRIRVPQLRHPLLAQRVAELRGGGATVVLLGEPGGGQMGEELAAALVGVLEGVSGGRVTIRCLPAGRDDRLSVVVADDAGTRQVRLAEDGSTLTLR